MQNLIAAIAAAIIPEVVRNILPPDNSQIAQPQNPQIAQTAISAPPAQFCQHCGQRLNQQANHAGNAHFSHLAAALSQQLIAELSPKPKRKPAAKKKVAIKPQRKQGTKR